jgi:starch-binding outer membrane protein, SusD/RagB family
MRMKKLCAVAIAAASLGGCDLNVSNPNSPTRDQVLSTPDGVIALATGLQARYASSYFNFAYAAGLVTDEFASVGSALISISDAEQGQVPPGTGLADNVFNAVYRTVRTADEILDGTQSTSGGLEPGTRSGLRALAFALKADALGQALQTYQRFPINTYNVVAPQYVDRATGVSAIRALLDSAAATLAATPASTFFTSNVITPGVSLPNTIQLFRARYARIANDNVTALAAANLVARSGTAAFSAFQYPAPGANPYSAVTGGSTGIGPRRNWRTSMAAADQRFTWFVTPSTTLTGRIGAPLDTWNRYAAATSILPVYFPDEALLIKAEALLAAGDAAGARAAVDSVRTDCTGGRGLDDPKACLTALSGTLTNAQLLDEIYQQRKYELFGTGLRWEDTRRRFAISGTIVAPAIPTSGQRCWMPFSIGDRNANPNVPADPTEPTVFPSACAL